MKKPPGDKRGGQEKDRLKPEDRGVCGLCRQGEAREIEDARGDQPGKASGNRLRYTEDTHPCAGSPLTFRGDAHHGTDGPHNEQPVAKAKHDREGQ